MSQGYHETRLAEDARRGAVWRALWHYHFRHQITPDAAVLDLGAGYGDFINSVVAARRIAVDRWPGMAEHLAPGVEAIIGPADRLGTLADQSIDYAFASNLVEHLTQADFTAMLAELARVLRPDGRLTLIQPNYRYAYREYFDDYTHIAVYSHITLADLLASQGWTVETVRPRFLPLTVKSRLPVWGPLIGAYLASPIKPMGKQMLITARPPRP